MLRKVFIGFCLFFILNDSHVLGYCNQRNSPDSGKSSFEVRGIIQPCARKLSGKDKDGTNKEEMENDLQMKCSTKIYVTLKITNREPVKCHDHVILLDHVYDPLTNESSRLLNPIVFRVKQEPILKIYDLTLLQLVNAEPKAITRKQKSYSKKCKKPVACGSTLRGHRKSHINGACCWCDEKKSHHHSKCNKDSHTSCIHNQPGSLAYKNCVTTALNSCITGDSHHRPQELQNLFPVPYILGNNMNDGVCHGKRNCRAKSHILTGDGMANDLLHEWRSEVYTNDIDNDGTQALLTVNDNATILTGEKYFNAGKIVGHDEFESNDGGSVHATHISTDGSSLVNSFVSDDGPSLNGNKEHVTVPHTRQMAGGAAINPIYDLQLDDVEVVSGEDETANGKLQEKLKRGASSPDSFTFMDGRHEIVSDYAEENIEDDSEFHKIRNEGLESGREFIRDEHCLHGASNFVIHCLKFSNLWYEVYQLSNSTFKHILSLQMFEKKNSRGGSKEWVEITRGKPVRLGSDFITNDDSYKYQVLEIQDGLLLLNPEIHRLLVPHLVEGLSKKEHPEVTGKPEQFLILSEDLISTNGSECDKAGVSAETYVKQKGLCAAKPGFCLKNQPSTLWRIDKENSKHGHKGKYFLKNFGPLSKTPYVIDEISGNKTLAQDFNGTHVSLADIVVPASNNYVIRKGIPAQITAIVADATRPSHTILTVSVTNLGLASAQFTVQLGKCYPVDIKGESFVEAWWSNDSSVPSKNSSTIVISPLHQSDFTIDLSDKPLPSKVTCIVEIHNEKRHVLAVRRVTFKNGGRCICLWHCKCDCMKTMVKIKCTLMTVSEVNAAGLKGTIPALLPLKPYGYLIVFQSDDHSHYILFFLLGIILILLLLGFAKAILGATFWHSIWACGLPYYCGPKKLIHYREEELVHRKVNFDKEGYPVHPDTKRRTVQLYNRWIELLLNILIFLVFPILALFWWPICWCFSLCHCNIIGYRWIFSATKKSSSVSQDSGSESSSPGSPVTCAPENVAKSSCEGTSASKSSSKIESDGRSGQSNSSSQWKIKDQEVKENESNVGDVDAIVLEKIQSEIKSPEGANHHSSAIGQIMEDGFHPLPEPGPLQVGSKLRTSMGHLPSYESRLSIEAYNGTADEQEADDVDYVLKQLHQSSAAIQKSQERISSVGGLSTNRVMSISKRGEVVEDPEVSPRMETSSDESVPGGLMAMQMAAEGKQNDFVASGSVMDGWKPTIPALDEIEPQTLEMPSVPSSQGLTGNVSTLPAIIEYSFQNSQMAPAVQGVSEITASALEERGLGNLSIVTTKDSLEEDQEGEENITGEANEALVNKLHAQRVVFRNIVQPIGGVQFPSNQPYCIRGYFLKTNGGYKFIPPTPLWQYWTLDADGNNIEALVPSKILFSNEFERDYTDVWSVAEAGDLSEFPLSTCINVIHQGFDSPVSLSSESKS